MKIKKILALTLVMVTLLAGCNKQQEATTPTAQTGQVEQQEEVKEVQPEVIEAPVEEKEEPASEKWNPRDYPDPTLPENMAASFYVWNHIEYKGFGNFSDFERITTKIPDYATNPEANFMEMSLMLPKMYRAENEGIVYDGGFANDTLTVGGIHAYFFEPVYDVNLSFLENAKLITHGFSIDGVLRGVSYDMVENEENITGNYTVGDKFVRCIYEEGSQNNELIYLVEPEEGRYTVVIFKTSREATATDLEIYDKMVDSLKFVK